MWLLHQKREGMQICPTQRSHTVGLASNCAWKDLLLKKVSTGLDGRRQDKMWYHGDERSFCGKWLKKPVPSIYQTFLFLRSEHFLHAPQISFAFLNFWTSTHFPLIPPLPWPDWSAIRPPDWSHFCEMDRLVGIGRKGSGREPCCAARQEWCWGGSQSHNGAALSHPHPSRVNTLLTPASCNISFCLDHVSTSWLLWSMSATKWPIKDTAHALFQ